MNLFSSLCYISIQWLVCIYFLSVTLVTAYKDGHDNAEWFRNNIPQPLLSRPQWLKINFPASIRIESTEPNKNLNGNLYRDKSIITINMRKGEKESVEGKVKKNIDNNHSITVEHSIESNGSSAANQYVPVISIKTISSHEKGEASTKIEKPTSGNGNHYQPTTFDDEDVDEEEDTEGEIIDDERRRRDRVIELDKFFNDMNLFGKRTNKPDEINRPYNPKSRNVDFFKLDNLDNFFDMNLF